MIANTLAVQLEQIKNEFEQILEQIFNYPYYINSFIESGDLNKRQAKAIKNQIGMFNYYKCPCCRKFDKNKMTTPIREVFEPLIDIAKKSLSRENENRNDNTSKGEV